MSDTPNDYEYSIDVPPIYFSADVPCQYLNSVITISISAVGGGTVGKAYADNGWEYAVSVNGAEILSGNDLRSGSTPMTHAQMARRVADSLSAAGESPDYASWEAHLCHNCETVRDFLIAEYERLGMFANDNS